MQFVAVPGATARFSIYQTRLRDFRAFVRETGYVHLQETDDPESRMWSLDRNGQKQRGCTWEDPGFAQTEDHPVVGVSWRDACAFCEWLTLRERAAKRLLAGWSYRLPSDHEWSLAIGLSDEDAGQTPQEKDQKINDRFPWGPAWPPPSGAGNYAGREACDEHWPVGFREFTVLSAYSDPFPRTAPVGSFKPNQYGLYDLGSNILEWCNSTYNRSDHAMHYVVRGASWRDPDRGSMLSSNRRYYSAGARFSRIGFRCVLSPPAQ